MNYAEYITSSLGKGTLGANISLGIFALIGVCAVLGIYYGTTRGFSKSVIRLFTVGASAVCSLLSVRAITNIMVKTAVGGDGEIDSVYTLFVKYFPGYVDSMPNLFKPVLKEIGAETATIFVMMLVAILITPILYITFFYLFRFLSIFLYELLSGLSGAISYGKGVTSTILGGVVGLAQGLLIAAVVIIPVSGLCDVATAAREPLMENNENPNAYVTQAYDIVDDIADNPVFDLVDKFGGKAVYESMITVSINDVKYHMGEECVDAVKVVTDLLPIITPEYNWQHPTPEQKEALSNVVVDIGDDELIASLVSDIMRGVAACVRGEVVDIGLTGASKKLMSDVMYMFTTCSKDTVKGDLQLLVDIYLIMCDDNLISAFVSADPEEIRHVLTEKREDGSTPIEHIIDRLNSYDRSTYIVTSFTKLSISTIMGSTEFDETTEQLYESVKDDITTVLSHNKSDFETEEEYKQAVTDDLNKALADNNLEVEESVKQSMVDYIADNYGDFEGEITEQEVNDALLSYYQSYANNKGNLGNTPEGGETPEVELPEVETPEN